MATYYVYVNIDKREYLDPEKFGGGIKFSEVASSRQIGKALALLLRCGGRWCGDRIVLAGDDQGLGVKDQDLLRELQNLQLWSLYQLAKYHFGSVDPTELE